MNPLMEERGIKQFKCFFSEEEMYDWMNEQSKKNDDFIVIRTNRKIMVFDVDYKNRRKDERLYEPIDVLDLRIRVTLTLIRNGILCVGDLTDMTEEEVLKLWYMGKVSTNEVKEKLEERGLSFRKSTKAIHN
jgi:DNA-directed RNA polymerase alpha subunit